MSSAISALALGSPADTYTSAPAQAAKQQPPPPPPPADTVKLSEYAQITQLKDLGQTDLEIAQNLGISVSTVDSELGIAAATATASATAAATQVAGGPAATNSASSTAPA
jgi:DNA-binding NarL/FixJ family response regulator